MPVTTSYSWTVENIINPAGGTSNLPNLASLTDGGFAMVRDNGSSSRLDIYNEDGTVRSTQLLLNGTDASVTQLDNGNIVTVYQDADSIRFQIFNSAGAVVVAETDFGIPGPISSATQLSIPTVTATAGGFVIGYTNNNASSELNSSRTIFSNDGTEGNTNFIVPFSGAVEDRDVASATLTNGNVAFAVEYFNGDTGAQRIYLEVIAPDGSSTIVDNQLVDNTGTINRNPAIVALENGGLAIVYEDNEFQEGGITMATYSETGVLVNRFDITGSIGNLSNPEVSLLANGMIALSVSSEVIESEAPDDVLTLLRIINPATGEQVGEDYNVTGNQDFEFPTQDSAITTLENGNVVVVHERSNFAIEGEILQPVRFTTGDNTSNVVNGDAFLDFMIGGSAADFFFGLGNDDQLFGGQGADWLYGGEGDDTLDGDAGADLLFGQEGDDQISGGDDGDFIYGGTGDDYLVGEAGVDWIYGEADDDLIFGQNGGDILFGGTGNDQIFGGAETDTIFGEADNDILWGQGGGDVISGQDGNDQIHGGEGGDFLFGGLGFDTLYGGDGVDQIFGQANEDYLNGGAGVDDLFGEGGNDRLYGGDDGDSLFGGADNDVLFGESGGDVLNGGTGIDELFGGADGDFLFGDAGVDLINGGTGNDQLYGASSGIFDLGVTDNFRFDGPGWGNDVIHDYEDGVDRIQFISSTSLDDVSDLTVTASGADALITFGMDSITILNAAGEIGSSDFDFLT